jgi:hypothetical protein
MFKEASESQFKVLSPYLPGWTETNHKIPQDNWYLRRDLNHGPPEYKARLLTTRT